MEKGYFEKNIVVTPDYCDMAAGLSPLGAFTIFQGIASEHAEQIGVGFRAMGERGEFWLTVHTRVDFLSRAYIMDELKAETWPEKCEEGASRCYRSYCLSRGDQAVAVGFQQGFAFFSHDLAEFFRIGPLQFDHLPTLFFGEAGKGPPDRERCPALFFRFRRRRRRRYIFRFFRSRRNQSGAAERD